MIIVHAVAGILKRENKILVAQRPLGKPYSGFWEFPGGKIEANESGEQALKRELQEELGIEVQTSHLLFHHQYTYPDKIVHLEVWQVDNFIGEPHGKENQELLWVTALEMKTLKLLEGNFPILGKILVSVHGVSQVCHSAHVFSAETSDFSKHDSKTLGSALKTCVE
jgi:8-oxo-dGTP diphosphatase